MNIIEIIENYGKPLKIHENPWKIKSMNLGALKLSDFGTLELRSFFTLALWKCDGLDL